MSSIAPVPACNSPQPWRQAWFAAALTLALAGPAQAQQAEGGNPQGSSADPLTAARSAYGPPPEVEDCSAEQEAAIISGEIIVCRRKQDTSEYLTGSREESQSRYAQETMYANDPQAPDVAGPGIFRGPATVGSLCIPGLQKCPPPPALMIDVTALPQAPPGSDADRIANGLPPLGRDTSKPPPELVAELGLPVPGEASAEAEAESPGASQAGSEEPEAGQ
ncbi:hypothetical protein [Altererythrobacter litoralis]|uniref:Uncharacterized protein n=1 Tax=Altererythrobacter litoralis TaxID=3113904 RepID=A0ABU7GC36_9SPHN|nr:hypothetical protein [Erythrobacteraceae bacterium 1XM1-14]